MCEMYGAITSSIMAYLDLTVVLWWMATRCVQAQTTQ
jgi:hypothetical protein